MSWKCVPLQTMRTLIAIHVDAIGLKTLSHEIELRGEITKVIMN